MTTTSSPDGFNMEPLFDHRKRSRFSHPYAVGIHWTKPGRFPTAPIFHAQSFAVRAIQRGRSFRGTASHSPPNVSTGTSIQRPCIAYFGSSTMTRASVSARRAAE